MTEDEAKTKWCPHVRVIMIGSDDRFIGPANRAVDLDGQEGSLGARCIASACMAWRWSRRDWVHVEFTDGTVRDGKRPEELPIEGPWPAPVRNVMPLTDEGFCGLAGAAQ